jgi:hypothetical protein
MMNDPSNEAVEVFDNLNIPSPKVPGVVKKLMRWSQSSKFLHEARVRLTT